MCQVSIMSWVLNYFFLFSAWHCILVRKDHKCKNNSYGFCYICSNMVFPNCQAEIIDLVKKAYDDYFGVKQGDQDKPFVLHICCKKVLRIWGNGGIVKGRVYH